MNRYNSAYFLFMKNTIKGKKLEATIRSLYSSLESHLKYTYIKSTEGKTFHKKCCKDYAQDIKNLCELL